MGNSTTKPTSSAYFCLRHDEDSVRDINAVLRDLGIDAKEEEINHHCTVVFSPAWQHCAFSGLRGKAEVTGVLVSDTHVVVELGEVEVESWDGVWQTIRPVMDLISDTTCKGRKGQRYHVTHSLAEGAKAKDSNLLLSGEVPHERYVVKNGSICGEFRWVSHKGEEFTTLDRLKKCPEVSVGAARTIFTGVGSYHSGDGGYDFLGSFGEDVRQGLEMAVPFGRPGCGRWPMSTEAASCTRIGMVRPAGREVSWVEHRDDVMPVVKSQLVTEEVSADTSSVITFSLPFILMDKDDERERGAQEALAEKQRLIQSNCRLFAIAVIANGSDVPDAPPPSVHRCQQKLINGEPLPEGELNRAKAYWYTDTNPSGWVLVDYTNED